MHIVGEYIMGHSRLDELIVPHKLNRGDTVALISLSGGRACDEDSVTLQEGETVAYKWLDKEAFLEYVDSENTIGSHNQRFEKYINTLR
jgi:hypothetical protein